MRCNLELLLQKDDSKKVTAHLVNTLEKVIDEQMVLKAFKQARLEENVKEPFLKRMKIRRAIKSAIVIYCVLSLLMVWILKTTQVKDVIVGYTDSDITIKK